MGLRLTEHEVELVNDSQVIVLKNKIISQVIDVLGAVAERYKIIIGNTTLKDHALANAKVAKGENYFGLPYVIMDFPRIFNKHNIFAIRSFFWWGNFFSITLHLSGTYLGQYQKQLDNAISIGVFDDWYINASGDQWEHHFESNNYTALSHQDYLIDGDKTFIKLARKIPINNFEDCAVFFEENFSTLINVLTNQAPMR